MEHWLVKKNLLIFIDFTENEVNKFAQLLPAAEKEAKGSLGNWSANDVLTHITFWIHHLNQQICLAKAGESVPVSGDYLDQINDGVFIEHKDQCFAESLAGFLEILAALRDALSQYSSDDLLDNELYPFLKTRSILTRALGTIGWHVVFHLSDYHLRHGRVETAIGLQEIFSQYLEKFPAWEANAVYNLACFYAQIGDVDRAVENLAPAFTLRPDLVNWSKTDSDLDPIRDNLKFKSLFRKRE